MTVAELIELLKAYPPGLRVLVDGYEYGQHDLQRGWIKARPAAIDVDEGAVCGGPHDVDFSRNTEVPNKIEPVLHIARYGE